MSAGRPVLVLAALLAAGTMGCRDTGPGAGREAFEAAGDVDAGPVRGNWLTDGNVFHLFGMLNDTEMEAARSALRAWRSDTVRAFATWMLNEHAAMRHSADSLARRLNVAPVAPALAAEMEPRLEASIEGLTHLRGEALDRAYVDRVVSDHELFLEYLGQLAGAADHPDVQAFFVRLIPRVSAQIQRARMIRAVIE